MRINKTGSYKLTYLHNRNYDLGSALEAKKIWFLPSEHAAPAVLYYMRSNSTTLYINPKGLQFDPENKPVNLEQQTSCSALAVSNKFDFDNRPIMENARHFNFLFDHRSRFFLLADIASGMSHDTLKDGFYKLQEVIPLDIIRKELISGTLHLDENGEIFSADATLFNPVPEGKRPMKHLFRELAYSIKRLGCKRGTEIVDQAPQKDTMRLSITRARNSLFGDILEILCL